MEYVQLGVLALMTTLTLYFDLLRGKIYNWITIPALGAGLLLAAFLGRDAFMASLAGTMTAGGLLLMPRVFGDGGPEGRSIVGGGDVKFAAALGALTGTAFSLVALYYAVLAGAVIALGIVLWKRFSEGKSLKSGSTIWAQPIPFGAALSIGVIAAFARNYL